MEDLPVFKPVVNIDGVYDPATAVKGKIYLRLVSPEQIREDHEDRDDIAEFEYFTAGCVILVDHNGEKIENGNVGTYMRNPRYNMAIDYTPNKGVAQHVNIRRGDAASMYVDLSVLKPRGVHFG